MGMALTSCIVPAVGRPTFVLQEDEMEIGVGIHGEPGRERVALQTADEITDILVATIFDDLPFRRGSRVIAMVNGMGGTPLIELYIIFRRLARLCDDRNITISRNLIGNYVTSLEMAGCSITLLEADDELLHLWDAPVHTAALHW
jgi:dihydroxyacetone kinase-like protein